MVHTGFSGQSRPFSGWMGTFLFLVFCQLALAAGAMAADPEKESGGFKRAAFEKCGIRG